MYAAVIMLLLTPFTVLQQGMALGVDYLINLLNGLLLQLTQLPLASIDNLWTDFLEIVLYYVCIYLFIRYLNLRTASRAITTLTAIWLMVGYHLLNTINRL